MQKRGAETGCAEDGDQETDEMVVEQDIVQHEYGGVTTDLKVRIRRMCS